MRAGILFALALPLLLAACGEGSNDNSLKQTFTAVKTVGDSLAGSGDSNGGARAGVKSDDPTKPLPLWNDRIAAIYGLTQCSPYLVDPDCTNYAVGGAVINRYSNGNATESSITKQLHDMAAKGFVASDLLLAIGGGNDAADLFTNYLTLAQNPTGFVTQMKSLLDSTLVDSYLAQGATGSATLGYLYMTALANFFADTITEQALDNGVTHAVVVNMPNVALTPKLRIALDQLEGASQIDHATRLQLEAMVAGWVNQYNSQLASRFAADKRVVVADFGKSLTDLVADPAQYAFTNAVDPACSALAAGLACTDTNLSAATPPAGATGGANWWKTYAFSDEFHPTPEGFKLLAQRVTISMAQAGWL